MTRRRMKITYDDELLVIEKEANKIAALKPSCFGYELNTAICRVLARAVLKLLLSMNVEEIEEKDGTTFFRHDFDKKRVNNCYQLKNSNVIGIGCTRINKILNNGLNDKFLVYDGSSYSFEYFFIMPSGEENSLGLILWDYCFWEGIYDCLRGEKFYKRKGGKA